MSTEDGEGLYYTLYRWSIHDGKLCCVEDPEIIDCRKESRDPKLTIQNNENKEKKADICRRLTDTCPERNRQAVAEMYYSEINRILELCFQCASKAAETGESHVVVTIVYAIFPGNTVNYNHFSEHICALLREEGFMDVEYHTLFSDICHMVEFKFRW